MKRLINWLRVNRHIAALCSGSDDRRDRSAEKLGRLGSTRAVPALIDALKAGSRSAATALGKLGDFRATMPLVQALDQRGLLDVTDFLMREHAADALGELGDRSAVPHLLEILRRDRPREDWEDSEATARALGKLGDTQAIPTLVQALVSYDPDFRWEVVWALHALGETKWVRFQDRFGIKRLPWSHWGPSASYGFGPDGIGGPGGLRLYSFAWLGGSHDPRLFTPLITALQDKGNIYPREAAKALALLGDKKAIPYLRKALQHEDKDVQDDARSALNALTSA
jgi:hypothetical protein